MLLSELFKGAPDIEIDQLSVDSRFPMKNAIFFCLNGIKYDGHNYIKEAIDNGAKVIVYSQDIDYKDRAVFIQVNNVNSVLNKVGNQFYNYPNKEIDTYVVSGNYGKSSVTSFINYYLNQVSSCAYVGILGINYGHFKLKSSYSTLNILDNLKTLDTLRNNNIKSATFEASVRSLNLQKLDCINPDFFIYTSTNNKSSEYHSEEYFAQLRKYTYSLEDECIGVLNIDDESYLNIQDSICNHVTYGQNEKATYQIKDIKLSSHGIKYTLLYDGGSYNIESNLQGIVNVYNLTAAIATLHQKGYSLPDLINAFKQVDYVDGVMEKVDNEYNIIVDSAFDISSIELVCEYANNIKGNGKAIGIIPINYSDGENRIKQIMEIIQKYLDVIILTENESGAGEVMHILERCDKYTTSKKVIHSSMRSVAIENGIEIMNKNDVLLILGKGNENFLEMGLGREHYNGDKYYAQKFINKRRSEENEII